MSKRIQLIMKLGEISNFGPSKTRKLFNQLQQGDTQLEYLLEYNHEDLVELGLNDDQATEFLDAEITEVAEQLSEQGLNLVTTLDDSAPRSMIDSKSSPWYFYIGRLDILQSASIGFAGSRDASPEANELTTEIASAAVSEGWSVVSGGARGVDLASHTAALESGGETVIILPQGIATWKLPEEIDLDRVLILSEFLPLDDWGAYRAMQRNKSVVELSDLLVIPQTGEQGGTWNAGEYAVKRKRPTFVANLGDQFMGNRKLIKLGATELEWAGDFTVFSEMLDERNEENPSQASLF